MVCCISYNYGYNFHITHKEPLYSEKKMRLTVESKLFLGIFLITMVIIGIAVIFLSRPTSKYSREEMLLPTAITKGNDQANVYLVEFSDFQCPACKTFKPTVKKITEDYKDELIFGYRHFPLVQHSYAQKAAYASEAAGKQGKFWEMYEFLFENQEQLSDEKIRQGAEKIGLSMDQFEISMKSDEIRNKVAKDVSDGNRFGVNATPTFFLNGEKLELFSKDDLENAIKKAINKSKT